MSVRTWALIVAVVGLLAAPAASAVVQAKQVDDETYYVVAAEPGAVAGLYKETNGCSGFQGTATDCQGTQVPPDERVDSYGEAWDLLADGEDHTWDYVVCLWDAVWDTIGDGYPGWCGTP